MNDVLEYIHDLSGWNGIEGNLNRARPTTRHFTVLPVSNTSEGTTVDLEGKHYSTIMESHSVQFFGEGAVEAAQSFKDRADSGIFDHGREFTYISTSDIRRLDEQLSSKLHERALFELNIRRVREVTINIDPVEQVDLNVEGDEFSVTV